MSEAEIPVIPYARPADQPEMMIPQQPWWLGSLLCILVVLTSHYGMLELFGKLAYVTTFAMLALGLFMGFLGALKARGQLGLSIVGIVLNALCAGIAIWMVMHQP